MRCRAGEKGLSRPCMSCQWGVLFTEPAAPHCFASEPALQQRPRLVLRQFVELDIDHASITFAAEVVVSPMRVSTALDLCT